MGTLTQGLEDAGGFLGGADGLEVCWQGQVIAGDGQGALGLQAGAEHPLPLQVTHVLHRLQVDLEALVLGAEWRGDGRVSDPSLGDQSSSEPVSLSGSQSLPPSQGQICWIWHI